MMKVFTRPTSASDFLGVLFMSIQYNYHTNNINHFSYLAKTWIRSNFNSLLAPAIHPSIHHMAKFRPIEHEQEHISQIPLLHSTEVRGRLKSIKEKYCLWLSTNFLLLIGSFQII
jgi:hypothetical protein